MNGKDSFKKKACAGEELGRNMRNISIRQLSTEENGGQNIESSINIRDYKIYYF